MTYATESFVVSENAAVGKGGVMFMLVVVVVGVGVLLVVVVLVLVLVSTLLL